MTNKGVFKKLLCFIIAVAIIAVSIPFTALAAAPAEANFGVMSDLHYFARNSMGPDINKFIEVCKLDNSTSYLAQSVLECALASFEEMADRGEIDFVLIPGDLTKNGEKAGHVELAARLHRFEQETGIPVYLINGNHDINNGSAAKFNGTEWVDDTPCTPEEFESIYYEFGYDEALSRYQPADGEYEGGLSYTANLGDGYRLIAIDGGRYSADNTDDGTDEHETAGSMSPELLAWVKAETERAIADGRTPIGLTHFNIVPHFDCEADLFEAFVMKEWEKCADTLADAGMHYVFTGHVHMQDVASYVSDNGETITDIVTSTLLSYPNQFRTVSLETEADGKITLDYKTHDIDEVKQVEINGAPQARPFKIKSFGLNFGEGGIKSFIMNKLEFELRYGIGKDIENAGGLFNYLDNAIDLDTALKEATNSELLGGISSSALKAVLLTLCNQLDRKYIQDPEYTLTAVEPMIDKVLNVEISDYPCTKFADTLGFASSGEKGTVGDLASTVLAYHYTNDEYPHDDRFLQSALQRFDNGENAETLVDTLLTVILDDLLQGEILASINIDPISIGINGSNPEIFQTIADAIAGIVGADGFTGLGAGDVISILLMTGLLGGDKLSDVVYSALSEYLTQSQYDIIDAEFYRIMKDFTYDETPAEKADLNGTAVYNGRVPVTATAYNLRRPSNIAVTFGADTKTTRNISYFTKYSVTRTDVQIVPYSENPDFSRGTTVNANISTNCEKEVTRSYASIDLGFLGILYHDIYINRHTVKITGLEAGKKYCYRVGDASRNWWSDVGVLETADNSNAFSFFHMTDPQSVTEKQYNNNWAMTVDTAFKNHSGSDFILTTGDMVDHGGDFRHWQRMFNSASDNLIDTALMEAVGNHEAKTENAIVDNYLLTNLPEQDTTTGVYYSFDYNTAHFAILNTNALNSDGTLSNEQLEWLKADMNASKQPWKFVALHKAPYSNGAHFDDSDVIALREQLSVLMPELSIDMVFQGHDHVYMRTDAMNNNEVVASEKQTLKYNGLEYTSKIKPEGTVYSINGTAGVKHYEPKPQEETDQLFPTAEKIISIDIPTYSYIQIDGGNLYFDSYSVENGTETRIDQFAISKVVTLPDGTVIDGTTGENVISNGQGSGNGSDISGISGTSSAGRIAFYTSAAAVCVVMIVLTYMTAVIIKRRREED
ncbi:MAG: metallophosphoesterase [Candidatus Fimenecus sp.]